MGDLLVLILIIVVLIGYVIYRRKKVAKLKAKLILKNKVYNFAQIITGLLHREIIL